LAKTEAFVTGSKKNKGLSHNPVAQLRLGMLYSRGEGVKFDLIEAYMWVALAGSSKHPEALNYLNTLSAKMTARQILAAQTRAQKWTQEHPREPEEEDLNRVVYDPQ
jgi:TPR repeat protein